MALESAGSQKFPYTYEQVFNGLLEALPLNGFKIKEQDKNLGRVMVASGMSAFSWGENIDISVEDIDGYSTRIEVHSALKVQQRGAMFTGEHRNSKNVNAIIFALNDYLKTQPKPQKPAPSQPQPPVASAAPPPPPSLYVYLNNEVKGPFTADQLKALVSVGSVTPETPCCREGSQDWQTVNAYAK
jgi:hypothetical protein